MSNLIKMFLIEMYQFHLKVPLYFFDLSLALETIRSMWQSNDCSIDHDLKSHFIIVTKTILKALLADYFSATNSYIFTLVILPNKTNLHCHHFTTSKRYKSHLGANVETVANGVFQ